MWQMDFKGDFALSTGRCYILTVLDDHSRFNLCLQACPNQRRQTVEARLLPVFATYGLPEVLLVDNGPPWGSGYSRQPHTRLTASFIRMGIYVSHGRPYHPQTRGKDERFHRSLDVEVLDNDDWLDLGQVQLALDPWQWVYNYERPHQALGNAGPASRYSTSLRPLPAQLPAVEYPRGDEIRKVQSNGQISFKQRELKVGKAFSGEPVALRATEEDGTWDIYYCKQRISQVDLRSADPFDL
jgi:transposase InsO family protein